MKCKIKTSVSLYITTVMLFIFHHSLNNHSKNTTIIKIPRETHRSLRFAIKASIFHHRNNEITLSGFFSKCDQNNQE